MNSWVKLNKNESGQAALEAAIILIAFVVVASVFAFAVLSAGTTSTEKGEQAIYSGLQGVQSSMEIKGAVIAEASTNVDTVVFSAALVAGGDPINLAPSAIETSVGSGVYKLDPASKAVVVIAYRDGVQQVNSLPFGIDWIVGDGDDLLEDGELAEITVYLNYTDGTPAGELTDNALSTNTTFTLEIKPPTGSVIALNRTTPAALETVMELR